MSEKESQSGEVRLCRRLWFLFFGGAVRIYLWGLFFKFNIPVTLSMCLLKGIFKYYILYDDTTTLDAEVAV